MDFGNLVGYDAYGLGNHEFDRGVEGLIPFINETDFPVVAANLVSFTWYSIFEFLVTCCLNHAFFQLPYIALTLCLLRYGLVVRAVACETRGPGFNSSTDQIVFLLGYKEVGKNGSRHYKIA